MNLKTIGKTVYIVKKIKQEPGVSHFGSGNHCTQLTQGAGPGTALNSPQILTSGVAQILRQVVSEQLSHYMAQPPLQSVHSECF